jgi:hypothetical protein
MVLLYPHPAPPPSEKERNGEGGSISGLKIHSDLFSEAIASARRNARFTSTPTIFLR